MTIVMVEQNARRALAMSDRGYVLDLGQDRFEGPGKRAARRPEGRRALPRRHGAGSTADARRSRAKDETADVKRPGADRPLRTASVFGYWPVDRRDRRQRNLLAERVDLAVLEL